MPDTKGVSNEQKQLWSLPPGSWHCSRQDRHKTHSCSLPIVKANARCCRVFTKARVFILELFRGHYPVGQQLVPQEEQSKWPLALLKYCPLFIILPDAPRSCPRELVAIYMKAYLGTRWIFNSTIKSVFLLKQWQNTHTHTPHIV